MRGALSRDGKKSRSGQERPHRKVVIAPLCDKALTGSLLGSLKERRLGRGFELLRSQAINKYGETIWLDSNAFREGSLERGSPWPNSVCNSSRLHMAPGPKPRRAFHTANRNAHGWAGLEWPSGKNPLLMRKVGFYDGIETQNGALHQQPRGI